MDRDRVDICGTLATIIGYAYRLPKERIVGPDWLTMRRAEEFAVAAKLPEDTTASQVPEMLQALLADRIPTRRLSREQGTTHHSVSGREGRAKAEGSDCGRR
jgi:uncharacterized protein (TIGR03435 family)